VEIEDIGKISQVSNSMISMVYYSLIAGLGAVVIHSSEHNNKAYAYPVWTTQVLE